MRAHPLDALLRPRSLALVGAGTGESALGGAVLASLRRAAFPGPIHIVDPDRDRAAGEPRAARLADLAETPDLVMIAAPPAAVPGIVEEAGRLGARAAVVLTGRLGSAPDDPGPRAVAAARAHGIRLVGPDSAGLAVPGSHLDASLFATTPAPGDLALVSQSGTLAAAVVAWAGRRGAGFSAVMALGSALDVNVADCLDHFAADIRTRAILLGLDAVRDARRFLSAARAAARAKPVVVLRPGRRSPPAERPATHTGALARPDAVYEAAFRRAGLLAVQDLDEMFAAVETLGRQRPFPGRRLAILANGGGIGRLAADRLAEGGGTLGAVTPAAGLPAGPGNPVDLGIEADGPAYAAALPPMLADRASDALLVLHVPTARADAAAIAGTLAQTIRDARPAGARRKPVFAVFVGADDDAAAPLAAAGIPRFSSESEAVQGFLHLVRYRDAQDDLMRMPDSVPTEFTADTAAARTIVARALRQRAEWLDPVAVAGLLSAYGIASVPIAFAPDVEAAAAAAWPIIAAGGAVALKVVSPDIVHKSDVGGVHLDLTGEADVLAAAAAILDRARRERPDARITGFAVQPMVRRGRRRELIAGLAEDPIFGPVVVFGAGGTAVEVVDDRALGLPPLDLPLARDLIGRTRIARRLAAYRDVPAADVEAVALTLVKLARLAADLPQVRELDINPLLADETGALALDARVRLGRGAELSRPGRGRGHPRFAIRPYPTEWVRRIDTASGRVCVRPVRPEDEPLFRAFFADIDPEDVRLRFFAPVRDFSHAFLARLTQLDYARAIAFVACEDAPDGRMLGAVRLHADAAGASGEFAILVRAQARGTGLATALMRLMLDWARHEGIARVEGQVLAENAPMRRLCRRLGFSEARDPEEPGVVGVRLAL